MKGKPIFRSPARTRPDGRKSLLVYLRPDVIRKLKMAALDEEKPAYAITEEAVSQWLENRERTRKHKT